MVQDTDTIVALATPPGRGGVGVVRVSGPLVRKIGAAITGQNLPARQAVLTDFKDAHNVSVDKGIALFFAGPASFTGEDVLELQGHGGPIVLQMLTRLVIDLGARLARPGEFSERAFLNNKLDLAQAEAVASLIDASSEAAARAATRTLNGAFSQRVHSLSQEVVRLRVRVEAQVDFPEEDIDSADLTALANDLSALIEAVAFTRGEARQGRLLDQGIQIALVGAPNSGKSTLLNRLAGEDRAIVTDIPGTTRDVLSVELNLNGLPVTLYDTAGLTETEDVVEREGIRRARQQAAEADIVCLVIDGKAGEQNTLGLDVDPQRLLRIWNKIDVAPVPSEFSGVAVSALTGAGLNELRTRFLELADFHPPVAAFSARARHLDALDLARETLLEAQMLTNQGDAWELIAEALRLTHGHLQDIVGVMSADDLLGEIFATFCIGK
ncbi:MAG: tRNA uridine-5-carboxymethylaminomethyl(34) synthesis GTPase MnmE [Proteobacteria bacterium]|nr:tRNA uridine-5-carboxymethylaminomethyl(34) synthesis GTPase MnmE [Pseudomonadota bacterium]